MGRDLGPLLDKMVMALKAIDTSPYESKVRAHENRDGSVDAEMRIAVTPRANIRNLLTDIEGQLATPRGAWLSVGFRYQIREGEPVYRRIGGLSQVTTHYQRGNRKAIHFATAKNKVYEGLRDAGRLKPSEVLIRLHANDTDSRPKRHYQHPRKKR